MKGLGFVRGRGKRKVQEDFDSLDPVAKVLREIGALPTKMNERNSRALIEHLISQQGKFLRKGHKKTRLRLGYKVATASIALVVLIALIVGILLTIPQKRTPVSKPQLLAKVEHINGQASVVTPRGRSRKLLPGFSVQSGSRVRVPPGSFASLSFPDGSLARIAGGSEILLTSIESGSVSLKHLSGRTYHRVNKGTKYTVEGRGILLNAQGTAFALNTEKPKRLEVVAIENSVNVSVGKHLPVRVSEGEVMVVTLAGQIKAEKKAVSRDYLEDETLKASVRMDKNTGYDAGIYSKLDVPLDGKEGESAEKEEQEFPIELECLASKKGVLLDWSLRQDIPLDSIALLRSESRIPVFPDDMIAQYLDSSVRTALDKSIKDGCAYQYRVVALAKGIQVASSDVIFVNIPGSEIPADRASVNLLASTTSRGVLLDWCVTGASIFDGFVVQRSFQKGANVTSPSEMKDIANIDCKNIVYSYQDKNVPPGSLCSYRIGLVVDGTVVTYSNTVRVTVPE